MSFFFRYYYGLVVQAIQRFLFVSRLVGFLQQYRTSNTGNTIVQIFWLGSLVALSSTHHCRLLFLSLRHIYYHLPQDNFRNNEVL